MININRFQTNTFSLRLNEDLSYINPYFIFKWTDIYGRSSIFSIPDDSSDGSSYNLFTFVDSSVSWKYIQASGNVFIYESLYDASTIDTSMNLVYSDSYKFIDVSVNDIIYDPYVYEDFVYDPSISGEYSEYQDFVFDPIFADGIVQNPHKISPDQILQDENNRFVSDSSIETVNAMYTELYDTLPDYIDGSLNLKVNKTGDIMTGNLSVPTISVNYFYLGDPSTDNSWRIYIDNSTNLQFQKRESGVWNYKNSIV